MCGQRRCSRYLSQAGASDCRPTTLNNILTRLHGAHRAEGPPSHPLDVYSPLGKGGGGGARPDDVNLRFRPQARKATAATAENLREDGSFSLSRASLSDAAAHCDPTEWPAEPVGV